MRLLSKRLLAMGACLLFSTSLLAFSSGSPVCEVNSLPLTPMSPVLSDPPPTGWSLVPERGSYVPDVALKLKIRNINPSKRARGVLLWAKSGPNSGAGRFILPSSGLFQYLPAFANCAEWALAHVSSVAKTQDQLAFAWLAPASGPLIMRAFLIEDCTTVGGCRAHQALTDIVLLQEALFVDGFEPL